MSKTFVQPFDTHGSRQLPFFLWSFGMVAVAFLLSFQFGTVLSIALTSLILIPSFVMLFLFFSHAHSVMGLPFFPAKEFVDFKDSELEKSYAQSRIPMELFYESFISGKLDLKGDVLDTLEQRQYFVTFGFTWNQIVYFVKNWIPETIWHSRNQDQEQVCDHYDRGDDFYGAFLGPLMVYTSGIRKAEEETLEELQVNKFERVADWIHVKEGDRVLDLGCGWGSLAIHLAKKGAHVTGITLSKNQCEFGGAKATEAGVGGKVRLLCMDARDTPNECYDKITCLEMSEHIGVLRYSSFLEKVKGMLADDGLFFLQIAGLRRRWQYEDLSWGLFMAKYVFPGADASCPLAWVIGQLEYAGFEIRAVETIGVHYSDTILEWYKNWNANKSLVVKNYGEKWWRRWAIFLAWSVIISRQGSATCYQILCHKNLNVFDRKKIR